jgi:hypothetical protein
MPKKTFAHQLRLQDLLQKYQLVILSSPQEIQVSKLALIFV